MQTILDARKVGAVEREKWGAGTERQGGAMDWEKQDQKLGCTEGMKNRIRGMSLKRQKKQNSKLTGKTRAWLTTFNCKK